MCGLASNEGGQFAGNFFHATRYFSSEKEVCKTRKKMSRTSLSMSHGNHYKICGECENEDKLVPLVLSFSGAFVQRGRGRRGFRPTRHSEGARGPSSVSENSGKATRALRRKHLARTVSPNRAVFAVHLQGFSSPLTCSLVPWAIPACWTFRGARASRAPELALLRRVGLDIFACASISARAARALSPTRASLAGRSSPSRTPSRTTRGT